MTTIKKYRKIFFTAYCQVFFVAINTYFIAKEFLVGAFSFLWTSNVRKIAFGGMGDRIAYSIGAACGSISGLCLSIFLIDKI